MILQRVIAKQQSKREQMWKYKKVESVNTQNDYETTSRK